MSPEENQIYIQNKIDLLPIHKGDSSGLRIDICLENPITGEIKWIDTTAVHTTCACYRDSELETIASPLPWLVYTVCLIWCSEPPSPTLYQREALTKEKYSGLVMIAAKEFNDGKKSFFD